MVQLSAQLQQRLRRLGIIDTSLCRQCVAALAAREEAEAEAALRATQQRGPGRQMWSSLRPMRASASGSTLSSARSLGSSGSGDFGGGGGGGSEPASRPLGPRDTLSSLGGALAQMDLSDADAAVLLTRGDNTLPRDPSCPRCRGSGKDPVAQFAYSEEAEMHALQVPGSSSSTAALTAFSPQAAGLKATLLSERTLPGLVARHLDAKASSRANSMRPTVASTTLVRKQASPSGPVVPPAPTHLPRRDKKWLYEQFEELQFGPVTGVSSSGSAASSSAAAAAAAASAFARDDLPLLTSLDADLLLFTRLHSLHLSGQRLTSLEHLPRNIRVVHAHGNRIGRVLLGQAPVATTTTTTAAAGGVKLPRLTSPSSSTNSRASPSPSPSPCPALSASPYPHLLHLGLGYNALRSLASLAPLAGTLRSLDASWNELSDLAESVSLLRGFSALRSLALQGNPFALHNYYRAAVIDAFTAGSDGDPAGGTATATARCTLDVLDGFATNTHRLKIASSGSSGSTGENASAATGAGHNVPGALTSESADSSRSTARSGSGSGSGDALSDRSPRGSARGGARPTTAAVASPKPATAAGPTRRGKKPTAAELAEAAEAERLAAARALAAEAARRAEEERQAGLDCHPTMEQLRSTPVTLLLVIEGALHGLPDPRLAFEAAYRPANAGDEAVAAGGANRARKAGGSSAAGTRGGSAAADREGTAAGSASSQKKKRGDRPGDESSLAAAASASDLNLGWLVAESRSESMSGEGGQVHVAVKSHVRKMVRYYFEFRLPAASSSAGGVEQYNRGVNNQDGNDAAMAGGAVTGGTGRGAGAELFRSVEFEWEQLAGAGGKSFPVDPTAPAGSPAALHSSGVAYAKELAFSPSPGWRDMAALLGLDLLLYQKVVHESSSETTTTTPRLAAEGDAAEAPVSPAGSTRRSSGASSSSKREAAAEKKKDEAAASAKKKADKKSKKAPEVLPPEVSVTQSSESWERHTLLGFGHLDLSSLLAVRPRKLLSSHAVVAREFQLRRPLGGAAGAGAGAEGNSVLVRSSAGAVPLPMQDEQGRAQWHPQSEQRLPVEVGAVARAVPLAVERARESGVAVPFPPLLQPPPHIQAAAAAAAAAQEEKDNAAAPPSNAAVTTAAAAGGSKSRGGGGGGRVSEKERERLEREAAAAAAVAFAAQQQRDPVYTITGSCAVYLNSRPTSGPGSEAFRAPPPEPTAEELAAQAAAAAAAQSNKRGRKSPAPTKKSTPAAAAAADM